MERYSIEQAQNEANEIRKMMFKLKTGREEEKEPDRIDYEKANQSLEEAKEHQEEVDNERLEEIRKQLRGDSIDETGYKKTLKKYELKIKGDPGKIESKRAEDNRVLEGERKKIPLDSERGQELVDALHGIAALFNKLGVRWKLDGALNISLKEIGKGKGMFFRNHRDVDVHVFGNIKGEELSKILSETKFKKAPFGYGAFLKRKEFLDSERKENQLEYYKFEKGEPPRTCIHFFKLDENGNPYFEIGDMPIDVHFDEQAERSEVTGKDLPQKWKEGGGSIDLNGEAVHLDHPGSMLYFKIIQGRRHDFRDIDFMLQNNQFSLEDIEQVRIVLEDDQQSAERANQKTNLKKALERINGIEKFIKSKTI